MSCGTGDCSTCEVSENRGCGVSSVFDWLYQIDTKKSNHQQLIEVQFKGDRKGFYSNSKNLTLKKGDFIAVEGEKSGHDIGRITIIGDLVAMQIARKKIDTQKSPLKKVYRLATDKDMNTWKEATEKEHLVLEKAKRIIQELKLDMKLSDIEFQGDNTKAVFYYTAESRVDFRDLIKKYSRQFKIKIEMRQIGARQEAAKIGGIGSCGRELCCSTWMTEFPPVSTSAARYQQLSINPQKISGQCGRLKCCLNFELDGYTEALRHFPSSKIKLKTKEGEVKFVKLDVFQGVMYYFNPLNPSSDLLKINVQSVQQLIELNKQGNIPDSFADFVEKTPEISPNLENVLTEQSLHRFDKKKHRKRPERRKMFKKNKIKAYQKRKTKNV
tara:strand:+ start:1245 stop:2396 length:1152 start_codon:yes stop_codon:yes gene_type:complete